jgi:hypothetical protein
VFLFCISSSCVLCMVVSNTYCVLFFVLYFFVLCLVYDGVQHILCCVFVLYFFVLCLVYGGVQHILCFVFCFVCLCLVSYVPNVASFSGLSILFCPFVFSNVYLYSNGLTWLSVSYPWSSALEAIILIIAPLRQYLI